MAQDEPDRFFEYYTLLGLEVHAPAQARKLMTFTSASSAPTQSSSLQDDTPRKVSSSSVVSGSPIDREAVRKAFRKASLKHHPDKGGNPLVFIKLKRARKVLSDEGLRKRYDMFGLDSGYDDCSSSSDLNNNDKDKKDSDDSNNGSSSDDSADQDTPSNQLRKVADVTQKFLFGVIMRSLLVFLVVFLVQFWLVSFVCTALPWSYLVYAFLRDRAKTDKMDYVIIGLAFPLAVWTMWASGSGGWLFWLVEATGLFLVGGYYMFSGGEFNRNVAAVLGVLSLAVAWYFQGRFWPYFWLLCFELLIGLVVLMLFPLCEQIVKDAIEDMLKIYSTKAMLAMLEERRAIEESLRSAAKR